MKIDDLVVGQHYKHGDDRVRFIKKAGTAAGPGEGYGTDDPLAGADDDNDVLVENERGEQYEVDAEEIELLP